MKRILSGIIILVLAMGMMGCKESKKDNLGLLLLLGGRGDIWTWASGSNVINQAGEYGALGVADAANIPGARDGSVSWIDNSGNLWLFGGNGYDWSGTVADYLNDLWRFDGTNWTWVSGSNVRMQNGEYGIKGTADPANKPGARQRSVSWIDSSGDLWLFGGSGYDSIGSVGGLNDLWRFDGTNWTWVSGSDVINQNGVYGTKGTAHSANVPGCRSDSVSWIDSSGNLWLFGGLGRDSAGEAGSLNDLWRFDGTNWTWISGADVINKNGVYGTKGTADAANAPGSRYASVSWIDSSGNLWLFGGYGFDAATGFIGSLNDLWRFDGTNWTWVSGSDTRLQPGVYGTKGTAAPANVPGARYSSLSWIDSTGNLWLFGGFGRDSAGADGRLNDLWSFNGTNWKWVSGSDLISQAGVYGTKNTADQANVPGARDGSVTWRDSSGNLWLFGGRGFDSAGELGYLNDLWRYRP